MKYIVISSFLFSLIFVGCATTARDTFYWGNYSLTLYDYKKNPDEITLENHKKEIISVIEISEKKNKMVPPGLFAGYGYLLLKEGNEDEGFLYFNKEIELYPESAIFITKIKEEYSKGDK